MKERWKTAYFVGVLALALLILAACALAPPPAREIAKETVVVEKEVVVTPTSVPGRQVLIVAMTDAPTSLDPADHRSREAETVIRNMFDGLVTRDTRSGVHLELAESQEWLNPQTLEIRLRKRVKFHNGAEMTADDVVFTFERIIGENKIEYPQPHTSPRKGLIAPLESVEKVDDYIVRMHFSGPWPVAFQMLVHQQIVPKSYLEKEFRQQRILLSGAVPSPIDPPAGCRFHPRCFAKVGQVCEEKEPPLISIAAGRRVACHLYPPTQ